MKFNIMKKPYLILICLLVSLAASAGSARANTAANTHIINNATLSYNDGTGTRTAVATVTVTVSLVPASPVVTPGSNMTGPYTGPGSTLQNTFYVIATSNGPDTYNISSSITGTPTNTSGPTPTVQPASATISLGATVTVVGSTDTDIFVPADGTSNASVNGITAGSTVVINGEIIEVNSVTDNPTGTSHIILNGTLTGGAPAAGVVVGERKPVYVDVTVNNITTPGTNITVTKTATATSNTAPNPSGTSATGVTDTYTSGAATLDKYVRNVTTNAAGTTGPGETYSHGGFTYYKHGITAKPPVPPALSDTLEYLLVATNSGTGPVNSSTITDSLPVTYVALQTGVYSSGTGDITYYDESNTAHYYTASSVDSDQASFTSPTLTVHVGTGATNSTGGSISAGSTVRVLYQVRVNP